MDTPVLSILIVTHNQLELLKRCLDSVMAQDLQVPFEVIISDDRSSDGTRDWVFQQKKLWEGPKDNLVEIKYVYCNSDECYPTNTSERCGWNKLNAYLHAMGKYFVNMDADDYLRSTDIYQSQIDMLEAHPECSMCMQRVLSLHEGDSFENGMIWPDHLSLISGHFIPQDIFFSGEARGLNQAFMIRRHPEDDMDALYGKWFDDTIITYHHTQYGPVIFIDRADYVWVQYPGSISHDMTADDQLMLNGLLPVHHSILIPSMSDAFLGTGIRTMNHTLKHLPRYPQLRSDYRGYFAQFDAFIFKYYTEKKHKLYSTLRFLLCRMLLLIGIRMKENKKSYLRFIRKAII